MMSLSQKMSQNRFPILVSLPRNDMKLAEAALLAGVDGIKVHLNAHHRASGTTFGNFEQELPFLKELAKLPVPKAVMAGQDTVPSASEMESLREMGFEGFNLYLRHLKPHLLASGLRPILALEKGYTAEDIRSITQVPNSLIEASIVDPSRYGEPLDGGDLSAYLDIVQKSKIQVIVPTQKRVVPADLAKLKETGVHALLAGILSVGSTPESIRDGIRALVEARNALWA